MKILLVGGPGNGTTLNIKAGNAVFNFRDGVKYEYRRQMFAYLDDGIDAIFPIYLHGEMPPDVDVVSMIRANGIDSIGKASDVLLYPATPKPL